VDRKLTVARVRGLEEDDHVEVLFLESARIYTLSRKRPDFDRLLARLEEGRVVRVRLASLDADVIDDVQACQPNSRDAHD
jgi:hypothetical protein